MENEASPEASPEAELEGESANNRPSDRSQDTAGSRVVIVDRCHTLKSQRAELVQEIQRLKWRQRACVSMLLEFAHQSDVYGYGADGQLSKRFSEQHVALCAERVESRGAAHHSLIPSPKLRGALQQMARAAEATSTEELRHFDTRLEIDVAKSPPEAAMFVIEAIRAKGWMESLSPMEDLLPKVEVAWQAYQRAEEQWRKGSGSTGSTAPQREWLSQCKRAVEAEKAAAKAQEGVKLAVAAEKLRQEQRALGMQPVPCWIFDVPEVSQVLAQRGILPACFVPADAPHVTLLQLTADGDDSAAALQLGLAPEQFAAMREALEALEGEQFEMRMTKIILEESIACAMVSLPPILPCVCRVPHVVLGKRKGASVGNPEMMLEAVKAGSNTSVTCIDLPTPRPMMGTVRLGTCSPGLYRSGERSVP
ncbi:unnamed protein product [Polarella glacialis]|nr:unnamed protein product [Polarella glacialis]